MRPSTLAEAVACIAVGEPQDVVLAEFVDSFLSAPNAEAQYAAIEAEPVCSGDRRLDALVGAIGEYLAKHHCLARVPAWVAAPWRRLDEPWFTTTSDEAGMREYLTFASPAEFRSRNIFTEESPLRRARLYSSERTGKSALNPT
jgi:hypothetical protein